MGLKPTTPRPDQMCPLRGVAVPRYPKTSSLADRPCGIPKFLINRVVRHSATQLFSYFVFSWRRPMILITNNENLSFFKRTTRTYPPLLVLEKGGQGL